MKSFGFDCFFGRGKLILSERFPSLPNAQQYVYVFSELVTKIETRAKL